MTTTIACHVCHVTAAAVAETDTPATCLRCGQRWAPEGRSARRRWHAPTDLEVLARWVQRFYGRGLPLEPTIPSGGVADREQREDDRTSEFHRAALIHRRFESLRTGAGCRHYAVLQVVYLQWGPLERTRWADLMGELGWRFAPPIKRAAWQSQRRSVAAAAPRAYGQRIHDEAIAAYAALPDETAWQTHTATR